MRLVEGLESPGRGYNPEIFDFLMQNPAFWRFQDTESGLRGALSKIVTDVYAWWDQWALFQRPKS